MKQIIVLFMLAALLPACKKDKSGTMLFSMQYTTSPDAFKTEVADSLYTGFGDYITSITPSHFSGKFQMLGFQEGIEDLQGNPVHRLHFVDGNLSDDDPLRIADFSNNAVVSFSPDIRGLQDDHGLFVGEQIDFNYFFFDVLYLYQQVELPAQYDAVTLAMFNRSYGHGNFQYSSDSVIVNNLLSVDYYPFLSYALNNENYWPRFYIFGECDSTSLFNLEGNELTPSVDWPMGGPTNQPVFRISEYNSVIVNTPTEDETVALIATVSFDTENLIQIYAGADNIPYNSDDVFVYAPRFWERLKANLSIE